MKPSTLCFLAVLGAFTVGLQATPLTEATPVYAKADAGSPVITTLKAGAEPAFTAGGSTVPAGWSAVILAGPHEVYAANKDVTKALDVRAGSPYLTEPKVGAPVFTLAEKGDQTEITDYRGKWTKFRLNKPVTGFIQGSPKSAPVVATAPGATSAATLSTASIKDSSTPATGAVPPQAVVNIGRAAPIGDGGSSVLPRLFQGKFASTHNPLRPRRPYEFQLSDDAGARYAYVDVSKLLATEQLNKYVDRTVVVYGTARSVPGSNEMVVVAESLQLR